MDEEDNDAASTSRRETNSRTAWWRNPRLVIGIVFGILLVVSQGVEQWNKEYATPPLLTELAKIVVPALLIGGGLAEAARIVAGKASEGKKERNDT